MGTATDDWVTCSWGCEKCGQSGGRVRVWPYEGETPRQTADRHWTSTRSACVDGCLYHALAKVEGLSSSPSHEKKEP